MKLSDLFEKLARVPSKDKPNPKMYALQVVRQILGDKAQTDADEYKQGQILISRSWVGSPIFSTMDEDPGAGGAIGLTKLYGNSPEDIAIAAHEAFHALLHLKKKNSNNEHLVNKLASRWLQDHFSGMFLHSALETINKSKISYKRKTYPSSKQFIADYFKTNKDTPSN